jgi:hypothetical protein
MAFTILAVTFKSKQLPAQRRLRMTFVSTGHHRCRMIYMPMAPWQFLAEHGRSDWRRSLSLAAVPPRHAGLAIRPFRLSLLLLLNDRLFAHFKLAQ